MRKIDVNKLVDVLRCMASDAGCVIEDCPYRVTESIPIEYGGTVGELWTGCDIEQIGLDAADVLESLFWEDENGE